MSEPVGSDGAADPACPPLPARTVVAALGATAVIACVLELTMPGVSTYAGPALLATASMAVSGTALGHARTLEPVAAATCRVFAVISALLGLGQLLRALTGVGVYPSASGPADLALAATCPVALLLCVRLVRETGRRLRARAVLDAAVALLALGLLAEMQVRLALDLAGPGADPLPTVGYPAAGAVLCAAGLMTFAGISAPRRRAAGWLVVCFGSLGVVTTAGSLAVAVPGPVLGVVTTVAYLAMLASAVLALAADPGPSARATGPAASVPLAGVVVSYCVSFGVVLLALSAWTFGRPLLPRERAVLTVLLLFTFLRTLVWAAEGSRLTRQILRAEAYFRTLVDRAADVTLVLDARGRITWASGADAGGSAWSSRDIEGRLLADFVHDDDRGELHRALHPETDPDDGPAPAFRLRTREGGWRHVETVRTASAAGLARGPGSAASGGDGLVLHLRDVVGRRSTELELERLAYTDYLTGLPNRARLMSALATARSRAADGYPSCLLLLDLDGFKQVNDIAGHEAGDWLLVQVATRLRETVRDRDLVSRLGGDEFAVLVPDGLEEAGALAERIVRDLRDLQPVAPPGAVTGGATARGVVFDVSASIGVTELDPAEDAATTIRHADLALRTAKVAGKNQVIRHGEAIDSAGGRRTALARDLPAAIEEGRLRVVYQPVVGLVEQRVLGVETLVRWDHPELGPIPPDEFIPLAEDDGLIVPLERFVLRTAITDLAGLLAEGRDIKMSVNISVRHVQAGCLGPDVATALTAAGVPPEQLILELTESVMLDDDYRLRSDLATLRGMGCIISLDDFGKGYSSLAYLAKLPVDILKMDREFVAEIHNDERAAALVASIVDLGRALGMDVVAEGVETPAQLAALAAMDCRFLQGWLLGRPVPAEDLRVVLDTFDPSVLRSVSGSVDSAVHVMGRHS
jgi:diguanylate cyclase (GGDEF)-like protein/PAS domain S-box-containing protein